MSRPLVPGLVAEGNTDELFLGQVIVRQLAALTDRSSRCFASVRPAQIGACKMTWTFEQLISMTMELAADCHVLFAHSDHNERGKAERLITAIGESGSSVPVVPIVPVRETEAWLLADCKAWNDIRGARLDVLPQRPREVERIADPKLVMDAALPRRVKRRNDYYDYLGRNVDLGVLAQVPAYAAWVGETETVLKELGYL